MVQKNGVSIVVFYLQMILIWIIAMMLFLLLRNVGLESSGAEHSLRRDSPGLFLLVSLAIGAMAGLLYATVELIAERPYFLRHSYGAILLVKLLVFFFAVKAIMALGIILATAFTGVFLPPEEIVSLVRSEIYWVLFVYSLLIATCISFVRMVSRKFGPGVLWELFIGKYRTPREERRIFMFLDLRSATAIAEQLGHIQFSRLIQDCFADLSSVVNQYRGDIYQYVGDEAVLSWPLKTGVENNNCIHAYFGYRDLLKAKANHYEKKYGIQPVFKAGVHLGKVTVAEVGLIKSRIAYHGDVLNTAARLQAKCNELRQQLLISDQLLQYLLPDPGWSSQALGEQLLKGKKKPVLVHGVRSVVG